MDSPKLQNLLLADCCQAPHEWCPILWSIEASYIIFVVFWYYMYKKRFIALVSFSIPIYLTRIYIKDLTFEVLFFYLNYWFYDFKNQCFITFLVKTIMLFLALFFQQILMKFLCTSLMQLFLSTFLMIWVSARIKHREWRLFGLDIFLFDV